MAYRCCFLVFALQLILLVSLAHSLPFVVFHGFNNSCEQYTDLIDNLSTWSGSQGSCVEIGNGFEDSWRLPMMKQAEIACEKVKLMPELSKRYNILGISQGTMVARGLIEFCDGGPSVRNYVSVGGVHAGVDSAPTFENETQLMRILVKFITSAGVIYNDCAQEFLAPSGYVKIPSAYDAYIEGCRFLPKLNNEYSTKNSTYKQRFESLENLVLIKFEQDEALIPRETSWFGFYPDGDTDNSTVLPVQQTLLYKEDWIGLKSLDEAGKVKFVSLPGGHIHITPEQLVEYVVPYLVDDQAPTQAYAII